MSAVRGVLERSFQVGAEMGGCRCIGLRSCVYSWIASRRSHLRLLGEKVVSVELLLVSMGHLGGESPERMSWRFARSAKEVRLSTQLW